MQHFYPNKLHIMALSAERQALQQELTRIIFKYCNPEYTEISEICYKMNNIHKRLYELSTLIPPNSKYFLSLAPSRM